MSTHIYIQSTLNTQTFQVSGIEQLRPYYIAAFFQFLFDLVVWTSKRNSVWPVKANDFSQVVHKVLHSKMVLGSVCHQFRNGYQSNPKQLVTALHFTTVQWVKGLHVLWLVRPIILYTVKPFYWPNFKVFIKYLRIHYGNYKQAAVFNLFHSRSEYTWYTVSLWNYLSELLRRAPACWQLGVLPITTVS